MPSQRTLPPDHPPFVQLPVQYVAVRRADERLAVHVAGRPRTGRVPVICIAGYQRNMSDFTELIGYLHRLLDADWPLVLIDLRGRGRSSDRDRRNDYVSPNDAHDVAVVADALAIDRAVIVGQGYGGQVAMALAAERPTLNAGTVLIDAGPISDPRGLVRLRNNLSDIDSLHGEVAFLRMTRQMLAIDYPGSNEAQLDALAQRTHFIDGRGGVRALFDRGLVGLLAGFEHDDVLVAQWGLFAALATAPLLLMRTQLTEQLRRETFEEMMRRRRDAQGFIIEGQGSPALLDNLDDVLPIADFVRNIGYLRQRRRTETA